MEAILRLLALADAEQLRLVYIAALNLILTAKHHCPDCGTVVLC